MDTQKYSVQLALNLLDSLPHNAGWDQSRSSFQKQRDHPVLLTSRDTLAGRGGEGSRVGSALFLPSFPKDSGLAGRARGSSACSQHSSSEVPLGCQDTEGEQRTPQSAGLAADHV